MCRLDQSGHSYSYTSKSARGPGYSYSYSYSDGGSPLFLPIYASHFHTYTPLFIPPIDFDLDLDLDDIDDLDFFIDTDLDLDLDLDFPGLEYGLGYVGKYGHLYRIPKYGLSRLYNSIDGDLDFWNYGGPYGYTDLNSPSLFGSLLSFFK